MEGDSQDELTRFRQQWIEEVTTTTSHQHQQPPSRNSPQQEHSALYIYARAVYYERNGLIDHALQDYKKALRLQPNVDRAYHNLTLHDIYTLETHWVSAAQFQYRHPESSSSSLYNSNHHEPLPAQPNLDPDSSSPTNSTKCFLNDLLTSFRNNPWQRNPPEHLAEPDGNEGTQDEQEITEKISKLKMKAPIQEEEEERKERRGLVFEPAEIGVECGIEKLPVELMEHEILSVQGYDRASIHLLVASIEAFGRVCRLARVLTLRSPVWRDICEIIYSHDLTVNQPDLAAKSKRVLSIARTDHALDWRRMFIFQPRLRLDGCYISLVRYPRLGESANPWYTPTHYVTYFRYLRFLKDGRCVSFTSTEEPRVVVRSLGWRGGATASSTTTSTPNPTVEQQPARHLTGLLFGLWTLDHDRVRLFRLHQNPLHHTLDQSSSPSPSDPLHIATLLGRATYEFEILAKLSSTRRGKMNKLEVLNFATTNLISGEVRQVPLSPASSSSSSSSSSADGQQQDGSCPSAKPYIFSRVVSYDPPS